MICPFVHLELNTEDAEAAKVFYSKLFGWEYHETPVEGSVYTAVKMPKAPGAAVVAKAPDGNPANWLPYIGVDDVEAVVDLALDEGGELLHPVTEVPGFGWYAIIADPSGAMLGLWETFDPRQKRAAKPVQRGHEDEDEGDFDEEGGDVEAEEAFAEDEVLEQPRPTKATRTPTSRRPIPSRRNLRRNGSAHTPTVEEAPLRPEEAASGVEAVVEVTVKHPKSPPKKKAAAAKKGARAVPTKEAQAKAPGRPKRAAKKRAGDEEPQAPTKPKRKAAGKKAPKKAARGADEHAASQTAAIEGAATTKKRAPAAKKKRAAKGSTTKKSRTTTTKRR